LLDAEDEKPHRLELACYEIRCSVEILDKKQLRSACLGLKRATAVRAVDRPWPTSSSRQILAIAFRAGAARVSKYRTKGIRADRGGFALLFLRGGGE